VVKTIGDKVWDKLKLRSAFLETQLGTVQLAQARFQRRQLAARRWPVGENSSADPGLCGTRDSADKFNQILERLDQLQAWFEEETCPDEYPDVMGELYGELPTVAGQQIRKWFIKLFEEDQCQQARQELPQWIAKEKSDVQQDRELYQRERALRRFDIPSAPEDQVAAKEAALERQIAEQTRLLLHLKSKRSLWGVESEAEEAGTPGGEVVADAPRNDAEPTSGNTHVPPRKDNSQDTIAKNGVTGSTEGSAGETPTEASGGGVSAEKVGPEGQTKPSCDLESTT